MESLKPITGNERIVLPERERDREELKSLKEYIHRPKITLDGREYVDKESFANLILSRILQERKYCDSKEEETGMDVCRRIIENLQGE